MGTGKLEVEVGNWEEDVEELIFDTTTTSNTIINCPNLRRERERISTTTYGCPGPTDISKLC